MSGHDDDLARWDDDPLVRALRGPATPDELGGEAELRAAFRAARPATVTPIASGRLRRAARRLGGGGTAVVVAVALGAGAAAAAYTRALPDPVQRAVHGVLGPVGVPAPEEPAPRATDGPSDAPDPSAGSATPPSGTPSTSPGEDDPTGHDEGRDGGRDGGRSGDPTTDPGATPTDEPTTGPSEPTDSPSATPTGTPASPPAYVGLTGTSHRAGPGEQVPLTARVAAADTTPVTGQPVTLLQRTGRSWTPVATGSSDDTGAAVLVAPALTRTSVFRLSAGDLTSTPWRVVLSPTLAVTVGHDASGSTLTVTAAGGVSGDSVALLAKRPGRDVLVGRSRLGDAGTAAFAIATPRRATTYVARLPRSRAHAAARARLRVRPPVPVAVSAAVPSTVVAPGSAVVVRGTVTGEGGVLLPGRRVRLLLRVPGGHWRPVGSATTDASGSVAVPVGSVDGTTAVRLRAGRVRSAVVRLRVQPTWATSATPGGPAVVRGTAAGGRAGDTVLLRQVVDGRLVTVQQATLDGDASVAFEVPRPDRGHVAYRLVLLRTPLHLRAVGAVAVRASR